MPACADPDRTHFSVGAYRRKLFERRHVSPQYPQMMQQRCVIHGALRGGRGVGYGWVVQ